MRVLGRDAAKVGRALRRSSHYKAMLRTAQVHRRPVDAWRRYLTGQGSYPWVPTLRTPTGPIRPTLYSGADVLTLNEIFCRYDYGRGGERVVVDIGANIGLASLFFLTRRPDTVVHAAEPVPRNLERLRHNLSAFADRVHIDDRAVSVRSGTAEFLTEETGRLGGLVEYSRRRGEMIRVTCVCINDLLEAVLDEHGRIDLVKIDTEGSEKPLVAAIPDGLKSQIGAIVWENNDGTTRWLAGRGAS